MNIVKELRKKKGIQQKELAISIGVSRPTVSEWESNKKDPSGERLKKLAEFFDVDELVILGKGVVDIRRELSEKLLNAVPVTAEARIISGGIDKMPPERREQALKIMQAAFVEYADYFDEKGKNER